jgi:uncharacterized protein (UPF0332 family)
MQEGVTSKLVETEKADYTGFFRTTYKDNLAAAGDNLIKHPRWCIIAGYYAMHDITKLFLADKYGLKINKRTHTATIIALREVLKEKETMDELLEMLKEADRIFREVNLVKYLEKGRSEREKAQYYTNERLDFRTLHKKASYFVAEIVEPFMKIMEGLVK